MTLFVSKTVPTASLVRNGMLNTARRAHRGAKGLKNAQNTAKSTEKSRPLSEAVLSDAVETVQRVEKPFVPFSDPRSEVENSVAWVFWICFGSVWACFEATDRSDNDFFNTLAPSRRFMNRGTEGLKVASWQR